MTKNSDLKLVAIGGGDLGKSPEIVKEYLALIGSSPKIVVKTVATDHPDKAQEKYTEIFGEHGVDDVAMVDVFGRSDAYDAASVRKIENADTLYFTGGKQLYVTSLLGGTPVYDVLHKRYHEGMTIAGTSAGAAMMPTTMIVRGESNVCPRSGSVEFAPGLALVSDVVIDTHFSQRGRYGRLLSAVAHYPQDIGIGIDEGTAIIMQGSAFKVVGEGMVTVIDGSLMKHSSLAHAKPDEPVGLFDQKIHSLPNGYRFDLQERMPIAREVTREAGVDAEQSGA